jgi:hypothetical protein
MCSRGNNKFYVLAVYHPPRPHYRTADLRDTLSNAIEFLAQSDGTAEIILAGDFNTFDTSFLLVDYGLYLLDTGPTHGRNILDKIFVSNSELYTASAIKSVLKTKHLAVLAEPKVELLDERSNTHKTVHVYDFREQHINALRAAIAGTDFDALVNGNYVDNYAYIVQYILQLVRQTVPCNMITIKAKDPPFVTPLIKLLLKRRYRLRKAGKIELANNLSEKINSLIASESMVSCRKLTTLAPKQLWSTVRVLNNQSVTRNSCVNVCKDPDVYNRFFASVSYCPSKQTSFLDNVAVTTGPDAELDDLPACDDLELSNIFRKIKNT